MKLNDPAEPGGDRLLEVSGTSAQVSLVQTLVGNYLSEAGSRA